MCIGYYETNIESLYEWLSESTYGFTGDESSNPLSKGWTSFNQQFECCGRGNFNGFYGALKPDIPNSCYSKSGCNQLIDHEDSFASKNCIRSLQEHIDKNNFGFKAVIFLNALIFIEFLGILCGTILLKMDDTLCNEETYQRKSSHGL
ncbi:hypothetical protein GJ496_000924 [Pomphorhynchus laevis]|nr:hypothetical protein GJ496_000924 [Pomphorhynchus laevis]